MNRSAQGYRVDDRSILIALYKRVLWDRLTTWVPRSVAPNTLTIGGVLLGIGAAIACGIAVEGHPLWYVASALCLMTSLTLDNIDGAHARRTDQCSDRGELLDHGLDGITSTATLVITGLMLQMTGITMGLFCALGALTFAASFWEQFRTGVLSLPKVGPTEGVTAVAIWEVLVAMFGQPSWLLLSTQRLTAGTVVVIAVVAAHAVAIVPPFVRASRIGARGWEMLPLFCLVFLQLGFVLMGANALIPAVSMGLLCAATTCHLIVARHDGYRGPVVPRGLYLAPLPLLVAVADPTPTSVEVCALTTMLIIMIGYGRTFWRGWKRMGLQGVAT